MKKTFSFFCSLLFLFTVLSSSAQTLTEGPAATVVKGIGYQRLIGSDNTGFYVMKRSSVGKGVHIIIEKYNNDNFAQLFSVETKVAETQESMNFAATTQIQTFLTPEKVVVFFESYDANAEKLIFFVQTVSVTGELSQVYEVCSSPLKIKSPIQLMPTTFFRVSVSPDGKSFAAINLLDRENVLKMGGKNNLSVSEDLTCVIYDVATFQKVAERIIPSRDKGVSLETGNYTIDNNRNVFFSAIYEGNRSNELSGFAIGLIENASPTAKMLPITIKGNKIFHDFAFKSLTNGDLLITGIVSDTLQKGTDSSYLQASYFVKRIAANTLETKYEVVKDFKYDAKVALGKSRKWTTFTNTEIFEMNDEIYISSEHTDILPKYNPNSFGLLSEQTINKEIVVSKITKAGDIAWTKVIPKLHVGCSLLTGQPKPPRYSGNYKVFIAGDKLNFVFLDSPDNKDLTPENFDAAIVKPIHGNMFGSESIVAKDKAGAVCVSVDSNGNSKKTVFLENVEDAVNYVALGNTVMIAPKKLLLFLENRKSKIEQFGTLNF
ncbi:MAG: hypothetical protein JWP12_138 [Bacteroidetes bacterium]|nr:hypothetical protein [Bacteroidota bacterium]